MPDRAGLERDSVLWFLRLLQERGYDLHALAHQLEPLTGIEYDRRYGGGDA